MRFFCLCRTDSLLWTNINEALSYPAINIHPNSPKVKTANYSICPSVSPSICSSVRLSIHPSITCHVVATSPHVTPVCLHRLLMFYSSDVHTFSECELVVKWPSQNGYLEISRILTIYVDFPLTVPKMPFHISLWYCDGRLTDEANTLWKCHCEKISSSHSVGKVYSYLVQIPHSFFNPFLSLRKKKWSEILVVTNWLAC